MKDFTVQKFPRSRIATFDVGAIGRSKHHVAGLLECDVTEARVRLRKMKAEGQSVTFTAWLLKTIGHTLARHRDVTGFLSGKRKRVVFDDIIISIVVEKEVGGQPVPIPLVIRKINEKEISAIAREIDEAKGQAMSGRDVVLSQKSTMAERLYYLLPGFLRRALWRYMLSRPKLAFGKMGSAVVTSVGMMGQVRGWFIHSSVHPVSFGIGSIIKKPAVVDDEVAIREFLHMTVLIDHDVIDGAPMVRFVKELVEHIETGFGL